ATSGDGLVLDPSNSATAAERPRLNIIYTAPAAADTTPPTVPTGLAATDNGASAINLTWNASNDPESGVPKYRVFRDGVLLGEPTATNFLDISAVPGRSYSYRVSAVNSV